MSVEQCLRRSRCGRARGCGSVGVGGCFKCPTVPANAGIWSGKSGRAFGDPGSSPGKTEFLRCVRRGRLRACWRRNSQGLIVPYKYVHQRKPSLQPHCQRKLASMAAGIEGEILAQPPWTPVCTGEAGRDEGFQIVGRPRFLLARIIGDVQDVNFAIASDAAENHSSCFLDPSFNLKQLPPHPRPEIDRDVSI